MGSIPIQELARRYLTDDLAGVIVASVCFSGPSGTSFCDDSALVSGTSVDGIEESDVILAQYAEQGTWTLNGLALTDAAHNNKYYNTAAMQALGFPTTFEVVTPSG